MQMIRKYCSEPVRVIFLSSQTENLMNHLMYIGLFVPCCHLFLKKVHGPFCWLQERAETGMRTLKDLVMMRPKQRLEFLDIMLTFTASERSEVWIIK